MKVLCVDDSALFRHTLRRQLESLGVEKILECASVAEGKQILEKDPEITLVISDHFMDSESGLDFLRWVRDHSLPRIRDIPFLLVIGEQSRDLILESAQLGVTGFLVKPILVEVLRDKLKRWVMWIPKDSVDVVNSGIDNQVVSA